MDNIQRITVFDYLNQDGGSDIYRILPNYRHGQRVNRTAPYSPVKLCKMSSTILAPYNSIEDASFNNLDMVPLPLSNSWLTLTLAVVGIRPRTDISFTSHKAPLIHGVQRERNIERK